jgi:hypothetical protein
MAMKGAAVALMAALLGGAAYVAVRSAQAKPGEERKVGPKYYRSPLAGMPPELYSRYENCMKGNCTFDEVSDLSDEMRALGYADFAGDLATLAAEMIAVPPIDDIPPAPTPGDLPPLDPGSVGPTSPGQPQSLSDAERRAMAAEFAREIKGACGTILAPDIQEVQRALGVNATGVYDAQTAIALAAWGVVPPPAPCELPLPPDWDSMVDGWTEQIMYASALPNASMNKLLGFQ